MYLLSVAMYYSLTGVTSKLQPGIPEAEQFEIAKVATDHLLAVPFLSSTNKKVSEGAIKVCVCVCARVRACVYVCTYT